MEYTSNKRIAILKIFGWYIKCMPIKVKERILW